MLRHVKTAAAAGPLVVALAIGPATPANAAQGLHVSATDYVGTCHVVATAWIRGQNTDTVLLELDQLQSGTWVTIAQHGYLPWSSYDPTTNQSVFTYTFALPSTSGKVEQFKVLGVTYPMPKPTAVKFRTSC